MKAVVFHAHGPLENVHIEDVPDPRPAPGECLIRVKAVSLNGFDPMILRGIPGLRTPMPMTPGADVSGEIVELGAEIDRSRWKVGARVALIPNRKRGMMGETLRGGACELIAVEPEWLLPVPDEVTDAQAACLPTAYGAAIRMMYTRGQIQTGEKVLILGASGGVGTCCVQLAKLAGCHVVAVTSSPGKAEKLKSIGADHVIDTSRENYVEAVVKTYGKPRTYEGGGGMDVVVNYSGGDSWAECFRTLRLRGRLLTCGATAGYDPKTDIRYIWSFEFSIIGSNGWTREDHATLLDMIAHGRLKPVIHSELPLERIHEGYRDLIDRRAFGKIVLIP